MSSEYPRGRPELQLGERRAAPQGKRIGERWMPEDLHQRTADHQVLLDLRIVNPRCLGAPLGDVVERDHRSGSTLALTTIFQPLSRVPELLLAPARRTADLCAWA